MRTNVAASRPEIYTHEGATAKNITPELMLRRSVMSAMLWESEFYENGETIADRIKALVSQVPPHVTASLAVDARSQMHLRHMPLYLTALLNQHPKARGTSLVSNTLVQVIQRADELAEFLAIYAKVNGVAPSAVKPKLSNQVRKGLAQAFHSFSPQDLAKYNRDGPIKLRDVLFLAHPKPITSVEREAWPKLIAGSLESPDTWEVELSAGKDKKETFERLIYEGKLGYMALLRNLRNMVDADVDQALVRAAIIERRSAHRVLPFRYVAAARAAPLFERELDQALCAAIERLPALPGRTVVLVDVSGSMGEKISAKSQLSRMDAAAALASLINAESLRVFSFSDRIAEVPPRRGMAGVDAICKSQTHGGTRLFEAVFSLNTKTPHDRLIIITDEQAHGGGWGSVNKMPDPVCPRAYVINIASNKNGVGYDKWTHLDGFSDNVIKWITEFENLTTR